MTSERWEQINKLYQTALDVAEEERGAFLERACIGDEPMRGEVQTLLEAHAQAGGFLEHPALEEIARKLSWDKPVLLIGQQLGPYHILDSLGTGGMGEVYKARDTRLNRTVAIKILPKHLSEREDLRQRLEREAKAIASLNHPNICALYDIGSEHNIDFLVMEYLEGETLAQRLKKGALPNSQLLRTAIEIVTAMDQAHRHGLTHRDLKPGNIMLTKTGVKLLDFGLAKYTEEASRSSALQQNDMDGGPSSARPISSRDKNLTEEGIVLGTLEYMAPEQAEGKPVDRRTDIFAFGVVLYEMATGRKAFQGDTQASLTAAILTVEPTAITKIQPLAPRALERVARTCLAKDPEDRWQTAHDLLLELKWIAQACGVIPPSSSGTERVDPRSMVRSKKPRRLIWKWTAGLGAGVVVVAMAFNVSGLRDRLLSSTIATNPTVFSPKITSMAVLPLQNLSSDPEQEFFADGMTEELITNLGKISALRVISRTSVMRYKGSQKTMPEIGRELNVDAIVEGTVQRSGDNVHVTANLLHAPGDRQLWGGTYDFNLRNVLTIQAEVAQDIANKIQIRMSPQEQIRLASAHPVNPEAYRLYLQGRYCYFNRKSAAEVGKSIQLLQQALEKEPGYALAYAGLSESYSEFVGWGGLSPKVGFPKAKVTALKALELDGFLAEAHASLGSVHYLWDWDWLAAESEFKRAIELNASCVVAHHGYAEYLGHMGRYEQAIAEATRARELDPLSLYMVVKASDSYINARRYDEAMELCRKALELDPNYARAHYWSGMIYIMKGMAKEATAELETADRLGWGHGLDMDALVYAAAGRRNEIQKMAGRSRKSETGGEMPPFALVQFYTALGDKQKALDWLEKAYDNHDYYMYSLKTNPFLDPLRSEPRFQDLLRRMDFPP
ncbi:MAG: protein kinase [Terriglobia bacterium]